MWEEMAEKKPADATLPNPGQQSGGGGGGGGINGG